MKKRTIEQRYLELAHQYEYTIKLVAGFYYPEGGYPHKALMCDLTTHLWAVYPKIPPDIGPDDERAWVYTVLNNKARNLVRNEELRMSRTTSIDTLPDLPADEEDNSMRRRMYRLIEMLDEEDQKLLGLYFEKEKIKTICKVLGRDRQYVHRRLKAICERLRELDREVGEEDIFDEWERRRERNGSENGRP
jgi:RNA polymerase sigma factor (sigma-70 family)